MPHSEFARPGPLPPATADRAAAVGSGIGESGDAVETAAGAAAVAPVAARTAAGATTATTAARGAARIVTPASNSLTITFDASWPEAGCVRNSCPPCQLQRSDFREAMEATSEKTWKQSSFGFDTRAARCDDRTGRRYAGTPTLRTCLLDNLATRGILLRRSRWRFLV